MFIRFVSENWRLLLELILVIASTVLFIVRKKPVKVVDTLKEVICRLLPRAICEAEKTDLKGSAKSIFALQLIKDYFKELGYDLSPELLEFASEQLEIILSTPQKKER